MRIIFHPVFILVFTLVILMFAFSMGKNNVGHEESREYAAQLEQQRQNLENRLTDLEKQVDLASHPLTAERILRDQLWQKAPGEENLELQGFAYVPRKIEIEPEKLPTPWEAWQTLIFE